MSLIRLCGGGRRRGLLEDDYSMPQGNEHVPQAERGARGTSHMNITRCTKSDYDQIVSGLADFWGHDHNRSLHHPMFVNEFRDSAYVVRDHEQVVAYLLGFIAQAEPIGYIHLVAVRRSHRQLGLARRLYDHFAAFAISRGCTELKAITTPQNAGSIRFHQSLGFHLEGTPNPDGVPVVNDYAGPGLDRVVFRKVLEGRAI
jgi:ribosomal protein S18 acetylase RimI-like enzyme